MFQHDHAFPFSFVQLLLETSTAVQSSLSVAKFFNYTEKEALASMASQNTRTKTWPIISAVKSH